MPQLNFLIYKFELHVTRVSGIPRGVVWGVQTPQNSEDIGGVLDHMSKKNWHLDFLL